MLTVVLESLFINFNLRLKLMKAWLGPEAVRKDRIYGLYELQLLPHTNRGVWKLSSTLYLESTREVELPAHRSMKDKALQRHQKILDLLVCLSFRAGGNNGATPSVSRIKEEKVVWEAPSGRLIQVDSSLIHCCYSQVFQRVQTHKVEVNFMSPLFETQSTNGLDDTSCHRGQPWTAEDIWSPTIKS